MWVEKYRPRRLDDIVGQERAVSTLKNLVKNKVKVNLLFVGRAGVGKTSAAYAYANELGLTVIEFNASDERGIQTIREKIKPLAMSAGDKIILLDEADNMTEDAQQAFRRIMEKSNARFILTANYEPGIIEPIRSRCLLLRFRPLTEDEIMRYLAEVFKKEGLKGFTGGESVEDLYRVLRQIIRQYNGDLRRILNTLEGMVDEDKILHLEMWSEQRPEEIAQRVIELAYDGDIYSASKELEELLVSNGVDGLSVAKELVKKVLDSEKMSELKKLKALSKLAEVEKTLLLGGDPYIQLLGFLADLMALRYVEGGEK